ncbi:thiamine-phosphate kinase [Lacimicrobium sp. SS2-24]|uniref:thiamine-phosphate kinase n=1 Tax=Lacimicrobium sp. SS2-24 TaxID=2005569 RepID=UPI000B4B08A2|nr:thiamine-phosphate kinase [Lacimicrobium sp. SS2-24]
MKEFDLIETFFKHKGYQRRDVQIGIGDDAAVLSVPAGQSLVVTTDTLLSGVHFPVNTPGRAVANKAVSVNLSDLAAMGAEPAWLSLSLSMPEIDKEWLNGFSLGLQELTEYYSVQLIGGDTVKGPLSVTITAQGFVPENQALTRGGAKPGDWIYVTGNLGDGGLALDMLQGRMDVAPRHKNYLSNRLNCPTPRVLAGTMLRRVASACIDISDGLVQDLRHILNASQVSATIQVDQLPLSQAMQESVVNDQAIRYALTAGDDYELLFTVSEEQKSHLQHVLSTTSEGFTCIGQIIGGQGKLELRRGKEKVHYDVLGFQHFRD